VKENVDESPSVNLDQKVVKIYSYNPMKSKKKNK